MTTVSLLLFLMAFLIMCTTRSKRVSSTRLLSSSSSFSGSSSSSSSSSFYDKIGRPRFISAPMVDQSSLSWRLLVRKNGADLAFSQMIHAKNFVNDWRYRSHCIDWDNYTHTYGSEEVESEARRLDKNQIAQFAGDDPEYLVKAGKMIQDQVVAIDLNLGCPQKIARKGNYGAYLLPKTELVVSLLTAMVQELDVPITAKLRVLPTEYATLKMVEAVEKCGVQMITLHGRTAEGKSCVEQVLRQTT